MRGIVSLAAALSVPLSLPSGADFPFRHLLIFLTYVVILATLVIPAITLPWLMRQLGIKDGGETRHDETVARLALSRAVLKELNTLKKSSALSEELLENTELLFSKRVRALEDNHRPRAAAALVANHECDIKQLTQKVLETERNELERLREQATIHDEVFFQLARELDLEETRLRSQRI